MSSEIRCSVSVETKFAGVCDRESKRYAMGNVLVTKREGGVYLSATDGRCLAIVPAEGRLDAEAEYLPVTALPNGPAEAELNGEWRVTSGKRAKKSTVHPAAKPGRFPRLMDCVPVVEPSAPQVLLRIDAALLKQLADAINDSESNTVALMLELGSKRDIEKPIRVIGSKGIGVIMPCTVEDGMISSFNRIASEYSKSFAQPE